MKITLLIVLCAAFLAFANGCSDPKATVARGVLLSVSYQYPDGSVHGFTRLNNAKAVPGGNGSWNIDAYGKLTREYLIITRPQHPDMGPQIIPAHRLIEVQFGDGGIKTVDESHPAP